MGNKTITELDEVFSAVSGNVVPIVINTDTVPLNKKIQVQNLVTGGGGSTVIMDSWTSVRNESSTDIFNNHALNGATVTPVVQPDVARGFSLYSSDTIATFDVDIAGTDYNDNVIGETLTVGTSSDPAAGTTRAYKTITSIILPTVAGKHIFGGYDSRLGLSHVIPASGGQLAFTEPQGTGNNFGSPNIIYVLQGAFWFDPAFLDAALCMIDLDEAGFPINGSFNWSEIAISYTPPA